MLKQILAVSFLFFAIAPSVGATSFDPQPNDPPVRTGGSGTRHVAQSETKECYEDSRVQVCHYFRDNKLIYTTIYNKATGELKVIQATQAQLSEGTTVTDPKQCPPGTTVILPNSDGTFTCFSGTKLIASSEPAPGCVIVGWKPGKDGNPVPIISCGE